jgi:hypothetical protein
MDIFRKIGIGIVMIVPTFVLSGLVWNLFHSWICVFGAVIGMLTLYVLIISGKFFRVIQRV